MMANHPADSTGVAISELSICVLLTFVAGAVDGMAALSLGRDVSHMSGTTSSMAGSLAEASRGALLGSLIVLASFVCGATCSAIAMNWSRRYWLSSVLALPLAIEATILVGFTLVGTEGLDLPVDIQIATVILCFAMGLQNAASSGMSDRRTRTTHVTGVCTDIGIGIGKMIWGLSSGRNVAADFRSLRSVCGMYLGFLSGGITGATAFHRFGSLACLPLSLLLFLLSAALLLAAEKVSETGP